MNAPRTRVQRRPVHGVLLLDKPLGLSSNDALQKCQWLLRAEKAGHTGTLDPLATGVLPLCFGAATKFSQLQLDADKTYEADRAPGREDRHRRCRRRGHRASAPVPAITARAPGRGGQRSSPAPMRQVPPMHSALKKDGKALYEYARAGEEVEREARDVVVCDAGACASARRRIPLKLLAKVSKGTYIRTLGEDIGEALGCGGAPDVAAPHRHRAISTCRRCITLDRLEAMSEQERLCLPASPSIPCCPTTRPSRWTRTMQAGS